MLLRLSLIFIDFFYTLDDSIGERDELFYNIVLL
jgi:hypothetical protein